MQRVGLGRVERAEKKDGGTWLVDHTNQVGQEKVLTVLRARSAPRDGQPLRHEDVEVLATIPGTQFRREDVAREYRKLAVRFGTPANVLMDGAVELRDPVEVLKKRGKTPRVFRDPKHFLANRLEALLKKDPDYEAFSRRLGQARCALQQTELAHFTPPPFKTKARFMNLQPTIRWAAAALWHLNHPDSATCRRLSRQRLEEKLGWLRGFAGSIARWQACQEVISATLTFLNQRGLFGGVVAAYRKVIAGLATCPASQHLASAMTNLLRDYARTLKPGERVPLSTEILESGFALYKQLEQQHSRSGPESHHCRRCYRLLRSRHGRRCQSLDQPALPQNAAFTATAPVSGSKTQTKKTRNTFIQCRLKLLTGQAGGEGATALSAWNQSRRGLHASRTRPACQ
jgi:hypothetical protein